MLLRLLLIWTLNSLALIAVANFVPGLVNTLIRPIFLVLTLPVTMLTLGLFIFVINGLMFWFAGSILRGFVVDNFWSGVFGAVLYSIFSWALSSAAAQLLVRK